jgi:probable HAF family extracellular repeat protein
MVDLSVRGMANIDARAIDTAGQVIGRIYLPEEKVPHAVLWAKGKIQDLNHFLPAESSWKLLDAVATNDAGQIVGTGTQHGQSNHAFLMTPAR